MKWLIRWSVLLVVLLAQADVFAADPVTTLPENRFLHFNDFELTNNAPVPTWVHEGPIASGFGNGPKALLPGTNHFHATGWVFKSCRTGTSGALANSPRIIPPIVPIPNYPLAASNLAANLQNTLAAYVESPVFTNGVGTLYFEAINSLQAFPTQISVDLATNMVDVGTSEVVPTLLPPSTNNLEYVWETLDVLDLSAPTVNDFTRYARLLDARRPAKFRIRRSGSAYEGTAYDANFTVVDNIRVSPPPAAVAVSNIVAYNEAGTYKIRCVVSHADQAAPATNRTVTAHYRWLTLDPPGNEWTNAPMSLVDAGDGQGNGEQYLALLPPQLEGGDLEFYVACAFDGYWYASPDYTGQSYAGYPSEERTPFSSSMQTQQLAGVGLYLLTVHNGSGGGEYTNGQQVAIAATTLVGQAFERWTGDTQHVANVFAPETTVSMPDVDISVTASYTNIFYDLTVNSGTGDGVYEYGQNVAVAADAPPPNQRFHRWTGDTAFVANLFATNTTVTMPAAPVTLTATYIAVYELTVNSGTGGGSYTNGEQAVIRADAPPPGKAFHRWTGDTAQVADVYASETTVTMPAAPVTLTASYIEIYPLTVNNGSGDGSYTNGQRVTIIADAPPPNSMFDRWTGGTAFVANLFATNTTVTMPAAPVTVTATYINLYTLTVNNGSGDGPYTNGQHVTVIADAPATGMTFAQWTGATQFLADDKSPTTQLTMPPLDIALTATYSNMYYKLTVAGGTGGGSYTYGQVVAISATVTEGRTFERWSGDTAYVANPLSPDTTVTMPAAGITVAAVLSSRSATLSNNRFLHFNDYALTNNAPVPTWVHEGPIAPGFGNAPKALLPGTNHYHSTGWELKACRTGTSGALANSPRIIPPIVPIPTYPLAASNLAANLQNTLAAYIRSPILTNGIGTVYFEAINSLADYPTQITLEMASNMVIETTGEIIPSVLHAPTNNLSYLWETLDVLDLSAATTNDFTRYSRLLNARRPVLFRIRRTGVIHDSPTYDAFFTVIDNIRLSIPPTDIRIYKTEAPFEPGYPSVGTGITVRCYIDNVDMNVPTDSRAPKLVYRWRFLNQVVNPWRTNSMTYVEGTGDGQGNGERYEATLESFSEIGDLEYFYVGDFGGYYYESPDYTATGLNGFPYPTENLSPRLYRGTAESGREFYSRLRTNYSKYGRIFVETDQHAEPFEMTLADDREWRVMVPLAGTGITNLTWRFKATGEYVPGSEQYSTNVTYWAGVSGVTGGRVPYGGVCEEVAGDADARLNVLVDTGNYIMITFDTGALRYLARRGEYQDFNRWPSQVNYFSDSNGQDPKHSFMNTFDQWPTNSYETYLETIIWDITSTNVFIANPFFVSPGEGWVAGRAAFVQERTVATYTINAPPIGNTVFRNQALRLKGGDGTLGLGYVNNAVSALPDGLREFSFKCRIGQTPSNLDACYYRYGFTNVNYLVKATAKAVSAANLSPQEPSVSLIGYYRDPDNFYEYRVVQVRDPADTASNFQDRRVRHCIYKWRNGVATRLAFAEQTLTSGSPLTSISDASPIEMRLYNVNSSQTRIRCKYGASDNVVIALDSSDAIQSGTFGFMSSECYAGCSYVRIRPTTADAGDSGVADAYNLRTDSSANFNADVANWYLPSGRYVPKDNVTPRGIYSVIPTQQIGIYLHPTEYGTTDMPSAPGAMDYWHLYKTITVNNFTYQAVSVPVNTWQSNYALIQVMGGDSDVVVDELGVSSWHGQENGLGNVDVAEWVAQESWVQSNTVAEGNTVLLEHSRANPAVDQSIRSMLMDNGLGLMEFDYRVLRGPAKLTVQWAPWGSMNDWTDVESFLVPGTVGWSHASAYLGLPESGYLRLLNERTGIYTNALVEINNIMVWDEPEVTNNSWRVYNVKITATDTNRVWIDESASGFLNNSATLDASPPQFEYNPFIRSPELPEGLGEISFYARAYTNNQAATIYLYATTNGWNADTNYWFELTRFENITNGLYKMFTYKPEDGRAIDAVRLETRTSGGARRVGIENISIAEPVLPNFDIVNVKMTVRNADSSYGDREQPLEGEDVDVQAQIANIQMTPSNIVMYVTYYVGTNVWGVGTWPAEQTVTRRMLPISSNENETVYRTVPEGTEGVPLIQSGGILGQDRDQVVQYYVWATYMGGIPLTTRQETFVNPRWYYPVDLNVTFAARGWSPYFFVYGVPPGAVWINEINATDYMVVNGSQVFGIWDNQYIEIAVPAWLDLAGWSVDLVTTAGYVTRTIQIPAGLPEQTAVTNGYAFFVIGDAYQPDYIPALPKKDFGYGGLSSDMPRITPGGLRLRRPLGMYEHAVAYDWDASWGPAFSGEVWAQEDPQQRFAYMGKENNGGSLSVINGSGVVSNDWIFPLTWTPGSPNVGQTVPDGNNLLPGVSNVYVVSQMNQAKATQNGRRVTYYQLKMRKGSSTNIVYQADEWYRLYSVKKDNVEQLPSLGTDRTFNLLLPDLQQNVGVAVDVRLRSDVADQVGDSTVLEWLLSFEDSTWIPMYYNNRTLTLEEQYWLDANPTVSNHFEMAFTRFVIDPGTNFHLTVKMALNDVKKTSLQGEAVLKLEARGLLDDATGWKLLAQYALSDASFDANNTCRLYVPNPFDFILSEVDPRNLFFRWVIERPDPRVTVQSLVTDPE